MMTRIALVTGASRGIGAAVAKRLAREGLHTILAARGVEALTAIHDDIVKAGGNATILPIDLTDRNALEALAPALLERFDRLDALVGNAATLGMLGPIAHTSPDTFARTMNINLEANFHLIRLLKPLLMRSPAPRAVFVTSGVANRPMAYMNGYAVSKAALEMMVK
ncbi:MAG: SDR family NAD(P)-dependent oxidoreductase, partial [Pseudomonadota bacterium]|nr:SDR family NAD(P)-dependent oxidoreductase [Pseudomonadota bacterium]